MFAMSAQPHQHTTKVLLNRLYRIIKPHRRIALTAVLGMMLVASLEPVFPAYMKYLLDQGFSSSTPQTFSHYLMYAVSIVGFFLVRGALVFTSNYAGQWIAHRLVLDLRSLTFDKLLTLPKTFFDTHVSSEVISKTTLDIQNVSQASVQVFGILISDSLIIVGLLSWLFYLNWQLTAITLLTLPLVILVVYFFSKRVRQINRSAQKAQEEMAHVLQEAIDCERVIKIYGGHTQEKARFNAVNHRIRGMQTRLTVAGAATVPITQLFVSIGVATVVVIGLWQANQGSLSAGGFVSFITAMLMLLAPLKRLAEVNNPLQRGLAALQSVLELLDEVEESDQGTRTMTHAKGDIRFNLVNLKYQRSQQKILQDINLHVEAGKTFAFVGPSGAGKSSLVNLIPRFYEVSSGEILLDGIPIQTLTRQSLREQIALVSQDVVLFHDTLAANISYGCSRQVSMEEIRQAAKSAHILDWIDSLEEGFLCRVGERGLTLSGGQRQRIAIARALLKNAPILILDEATSALDSASEKEVQKALEILMKNKTCFIIAHRLSTITHADCIVVLDQGRIVEQGTHQELLTKQGLYSHLFYIQNHASNDAMIA
jgi:subfamily B ATP-binding cassette protein MsbA